MRDNGAAAESVSAGVVICEKEVRRAGVLARVKEGELKLVSAAEIVELSYRQTKRLWRRYRREGAQGLVHGNAGRRSRLWSRSIGFRARSHPVRPTGPPGSRRPILLPQAGTRL